MKNYLILSELAETFTKVIFRNSKPERKNEKVHSEKEYPFVVLNTDNDYGFYVRCLVKEIQKLGTLTQIPKPFRVKSLKNINTGDLIVFGDSNGLLDYDYRVETNAKKLEHLDGRKWKAYDLVNDYEKVVKRLRKYAQANFGSVDESDTEIEINVNVNVPTDTTSYKTIIGVAYPRISKEKVTIFDNWVKIGYNQYDIFVDLLGNEMIYVDGYKFFIKEDRFGRKYLSQS